MYKHVQVSSLHVGFPMGAVLFEIDYRWKYLLKIQVSLNFAMPKRKADDEEEDAVPAADSWALKVETVFSFKVAANRNAVLRWLAALFLVRRWVSLFRMDKPRSQRYSRIPAYMRDVSQMVFPGSFVYRGNTGRNAPKGSTVLDTLRRSV